MLIKDLRIRFQGTEVESTVVQKPNQGPIPKKDVIFSGSFLQNVPMSEAISGVLFLLAPTSEADLGGEAKK